MSDLCPNPTVTNVGFAESDSQMLRPIAGGERVCRNDDLIGNSPRVRELGNANRQSRLSTYPLPMLPE